MAYVTDGSVHYSGIKNEERQRRFFEDNLGRVFPDLERMEGLVVETLGGTTNKADVVIKNSDGDVIKSISSKEKKKLKSGTYHFDKSSAIWTNLIGPALCSHPDIMTDLDDLIELKDFVRNEVPVEERKDWRDEVNSQLQGVLNSMLEAFANDQKVLQSIYKMIVDNNSGHEFFVTAKDEGFIQKVDFVNHPMMSHKEMDIVYKPNKGGASRLTQLKNKETGEIINTGIRIRLLLTNGVSAWIGANEGTKKNRNSAFCVVIQQDNHHKVVPVKEVYEY